MSREEGYENEIFTIDTDHIEVIASTSTHSDDHSNGSQSVLTDNQTNFRFTQNEDSLVENRVGTPSNMVRRWSQNLTKFDKGKRSVREKTIYRLPSRKVFAIDGALLAPNNLEAEQLAEEIEQHDHLMEDSAHGEQLRMDTIRALPHSLTVKREIKDKLARSVTGHARRHTIGLLKRFKYRFVIYFVRLFNTIRSDFSSIELWYGPMKEIEGHFGSSVGTYFKFLRWLFLLNIFLLVFSFGFITLPQILYETIEDANSPSTNFTKIAFRASDILTAEGYIKNSILFYGAYTNMTFEINPPHKYSLPHAYFMTMLCLYIFTFIIISSSMARSYRRSFIETSGGVTNMFSHKIFCSWDFGISNANAAYLKQINIFNELKEFLHEINHVKEPITKMRRFWNVASQITAHFLVGAMLAGFGTSMWLLLQNYDDESYSSKWSVLYLSLAVNGAMFVLQTLFSWISTMEDYSSAKRALHITLMRNFILEAVVIGVLVAFWLSRSRSGCWETSIGQEIYRLMLVDFLIAVVTPAIVECIRTILTKKWFPKLGKAEFDISRKSLGLVFNQTLLWVGLLFSPMLALVVTIKMFLTFYIKKITLIYFSKPPSKMWRSAQTQTLYLVITFLSLLGVLVSLGYIMTQVPVSEKCGPFRGHAYMFQIFVDGVLALRKNHWIWRAVTFIARPAVLGGILLTMVVIVYYLRAKSRARVAMVKLLKDLLYLEAKDKEFLLSYITRVTQGKEWLLDEDELKKFGRLRDNYAESSSTWRYESRNPSQQSLRENFELRSRHI